MVLSVMCGFHGVMSGGGACSKKMSRMSIFFI